MRSRWTWLAVTAGLCVVTATRADMGAVVEAAPAAAAAVTMVDPTPGGTAEPTPPVAGPEPAYALADRLVVHKRDRRLVLYSDDRVIAEYPIRLGLNPVGPKEREGDFRTPEGRYWLNRRNQFSDFFLSIGLSYPNDVDVARAKRQRVAPGGAIMIHGQPNLPRKPPDYYARNDWTDGCIAVSNSDMVDIWLRTRNGLPIEIRP